MFEPETPLREVGERALLRHLRSRIPAGSGVVVGVGDDAAAVETGSITLVTTDCLVEGVHFLREWAPARLVGRKALTVNLSDIAAMAGVPRYATVSLCLPSDLPIGFVDGLYDGLLERAAETGVAVVGGNVAGSGGGTVVDVALFGQGDKLLRRSGARPGDLAVVTGALGAAAEGLRLLAQGARLDADGYLDRSGPWTESSGAAVAHCLRAVLDPNPPLAFGRALAEQEVAHAAIDLSDGLSGDLLTMCEESQCLALLQAEAVPVDPVVASLERARGGDAFEMALHGGEDYQLLLAVPKDKLDALRDIAVIWDLPTTVVGEFAEGPATLLLSKGGSRTPILPRSFEHFRPAREGRPSGA
ncbi:MAG TPA: thiamine-phosphate kinase [Vicinamibacteria bacterium]|nr:thiamine-phosphate kinase [Vicinamibacteria bacterium]